MSFSGKVVYITGASSGIGHALAKEFAFRGAHLGILARREDRLRQLCEEIRAAGGTIEYVVADAGDRSRMQSAVASLKERLGVCDVMIANAGMGCSNTSTDLNVAGAEQAIRLNLLGPIYAYEAVLADMLARGSGHLVGISSVAAFKGLPTSAAYCASKAGLNAYLESIRISLRAKNIAVTAICPGFVRTELTEKLKDMFWVCDADVAARKIARAIQRRKKVFAFPMQMGLLVKATRWLPDWFLARALPDETALR